MKDNELVLPYKKLFLGGSDNVYGFETVNSIVYEVKFKPTSYIFESYLAFPIDAFEFVISVALNPTGKNPPLDAKIPFTIASIFMDFFQRIPEQVIIYICDSADTRQSARKRKFDQWVEFFKGNEFVKVNTTIIDIDGTRYHNSLIIRKDNPNRLAITEAFINLAEEQDK
ncbi:DUF6169 family protein [Arcicella sp. LKC2W]|uniref:DUF6169 family protein n=1 Tax=Arcicella sp. LKC2W TaxID=2984198 RepID=UPI002B207054|nr:DUF6169 family protein [Arcicella sp. LKC2W]MEA5457802.1 DUF6169 family protein [Arcicella sp. LKC2W]